MNKANEVYNYVLQYGLSENIAKFAAAQAGHETGNFTSTIFKLNNNCFGMKYAGQSSAAGEKNGYAYYNSIADSVYDWARWWLRKRSNILSLPLFVNSVESFVKFLKNNNYFEADINEYQRGVEYFYNQYFG